jgi:hypothetical protein
MSAYGTTLTFRGRELSSTRFVSLPESQLSMTYYKPDKSHQLLAKRITEKYDPRTPTTVSEFLAKAWKLANDKATELGWIAGSGRRRGQKAKEQYRSVTTR